MAMAAPVRSNTPNAGGTAPMSLQQQNTLARALIMQRATNMIQPLPGVTITNPGNTNNVLAFNNIRLVGFLKRFYIEVQATITNTGATNTLNLTNLGLSQLLSRITFTDLANNVRHNAAGWCFHMVASAKRESPFGSCFSLIDPVANVNNLPQAQYNYGVGFGNNYSPQKVANNTNAILGANIAPGQSATANIVYEIPISYDDVNLSGGMWLGVTSANPQLQITINPNPGANSASDTTFSVYRSATGAADCVISSITVNVYQNYLDQLPVDQNGRVILPVEDISTVYMIQDSNGPQGLAQNTDYPIPYANARDFISTFAIFDNGGTLNPGTDVAYWAIQAANFINFIKTDANVNAMLSRNTIGMDWPVGMAYFNHRFKPISTAQFGNTELVLNASQVNANAFVRICYEMFARVNLVPQAAALSFG